MSPMMRFPLLLNATCMTFFVLKLNHYKLTMTLLKSAVVESSYAFIENKRNFCCYDEEETRSPGRGAGRGITCKEEDSLFDRSHLTPHSLPFHQMILIVHRLIQVQNLHRRKSVRIHLASRVKPCELNHSTLSKKSHRTNIVCINQIRLPHLHEHDPSIRLNLWPWLKIFLLDCCCCILRIHGDDLWFIPGFI